MTNNDTINNLKLKIESSKKSISKVDDLLELSRLLIYKDSLAGKKALDEAYDLSNTLNYKKGLAWSTMKYGSYALADKNIKSAIRYYKKSLKLLNKIHDSKGLARGYYSLGTTYGYMNNFELSIQYLLQAKSLAKEHDQEYYPFILNNISETYMYLELYDKSYHYLKILKDYIEAFDLNENKRLYVMTYSSMAKLQLKNQNYKYALYYAEEALKILDSEDMTRYKGLICLTLSEIYLKMQQLDESEMFAHRSLEFLSDYGDFQDSPRINIILSEIYLIKKDYTQATQYAIRASKESKALRKKLSQANALEQLSKVYEHLKYYQKSLLTYKKSVTLRSMVVNSQLKDKMAAFSIDFNFDDEAIKEYMDSNSFNRHDHGDLEIKELQLKNITKEIQQAYEKLAEQERIIEFGRLTKSFVESLVNTIDIRDTTTAGHSNRIAGYSVALAKAINDDETIYKHIHLSKDEIRELHYAALLHDIGKLGIRENILIKSKRLNKHQIIKIKYKFMYIEASLKLKEFSSNLSPKEELVLKNISEYFKFIESIVSKNYITKETINKIHHIGSMTLSLPTGNEESLLTPLEVEALSVEKGNLTKAEYQIIQKHAQKTYDYLKNIPWLKQLENVPSLAASHHERMDGSGYPKGLKAEEIEIRSRILSIIDVFEALTASNRPYREPVSIEKALDIIKAEGKAYKLDPKLIKFFIQKGIPYLYSRELSKEN